VAQPVAEHALRQAASEMRAEAPEDHAELVFRVILDRQSAQHYESAPILDLISDLVDHRF